MIIGLAFFLFIFFENLSSNKIFMAKFLHSHFALAREIIHYCER